MREFAFDTAQEPFGQRHPDEPAPQLEARNLSFSAGGLQLLDKVDLKIRPGSRTLIVGPNGAGKSLLLRLLHGLLKPSEGEVRWQGNALDANGKRAQAMVFQRPVLLRRSVFANLKFALSVRGTRGTARQQKIERALASAGLGHLANRPARVLSGGEQQRLAVVRALACDPELLFLDEPTANLDPASTAAIEDLILEANGRGVTIVLVTHDQGQARRLGEELVFLQDGQVAEAGPARQVLDTPQSEPARAWHEGRIYLGPNTQPLRARQERAS